MVVVVMSFLDLVLAGIPDWLVNPSPHPSFHPDTTPMGYTARHKLGKLWVGWAQAVAAQPRLHACWGQWGGATHPREWSHLDAWDLTTSKSPIGGRSPVLAWGGGKWGTSSGMPLSKTRHRRPSRPPSKRFVDGEGLTVLLM